MALLLNQGDVVSRSYSYTKPSPTHPIMPTFCGVRTGNLCPMIFTHSGVGDDVGTIITMNTRLWSSKIAVLPSQSYYAMVNGEASNNEELLFNRIIQYDANGDFISRISVVNQAEAEITTAENCRFVVLDIRTRTLTVDITMDDITAVMLSAGSQAPYEPYGWAEKITSAGQTQTAYLGQVQTVRRIRKLVLTGEEEWSGSAKFRIGLIGQIGTIAPICTHYRGVTTAAYGDLADGCVTVNGGVCLTLAIYDTVNQSSLTAWKYYLAQQYANGTPVTVWYVLATPTTGIVNEPLAKISTYADTLTSAQAGITIPTNDGNTTISVDTALAPSKFEIKVHAKPI